MIHFLASNPSMRVVVVAELHTELAVQSLGQLLVLLCPVSLGVEGAAEITRSIHLAKDDLAGWVLADLTESTKCVDSLLYQW